MSDQPKAWRPGELWGIKRDGDGYMVEPEDTLEEAAVLAFQKKEEAEALIDLWVKGSEFSPVQIITGDPEHLKRIAELEKVLRMLRAGVVVSPTLDKAMEFVRRISSQALQSTEVRDGE